MCICGKTIIKHILDAHLIWPIIYMLTRSMYMSEQLALSTLAHEVAGLNPTTGGNQLKTIYCFIAHSISLSPFHCLDGYVKILSKRCKIAFIVHLDHLFFSKKTEFDISCESSKEENRDWYFMWKQCLILQMNQFLRAGHFM